MARRWVWVAGVALGLVGLAALAASMHRPLLELAGRWLIVEDRLRPSDAIVVLAGGTPSRERTAAGLFREGWAPRVIISRESTAGRVRELLDLGIRPLDLQGEAWRALERYGVPRGRIVALGEPVGITEAELRVVHRRARAEGYRRVILVTSAQHTRRVKLIWSREARGAVQGMVVPARDERFPAHRWWQERRAAEALLHEYLGILAVSLGLSHLMR